MYLDSTTLARFWSKVEKTETCWLWRGPIDPAGYGRFTAHFDQPRTRRRTQPAHRIAYRLAYGPIPEGLCIDHVRARGCTNRNCVNPAHLEAVTPAENTRRGRGFAGVNAQRTHCAQGHLLSGRNLHNPARGGRECLECRKMYAEKRLNRTSKYRTIEVQPMARYLSKKEAAAALGVSIKTLDRRIKKGDYARTLVHGPHGPEIRVLLDDDGGTADVPPTPDTSALVQGFAPPTNALDRADTRAIDVPDPDIHRALAAALRDALAANQAWARRYDALAAEVESLRRPWWRKIWEQVRRRRL